MLMGVANHEGDAGQGSDFFGGALGIASGDHDAGIGVLAAHSADGGAGVLIRGACYSACIQHDDRSASGGGSADKSLLFKLTFQSGTVGLGGAAAEVFYKESSHTLW